MSTLLRIAAVLLAGLGTLTVTAPAYALSCVVPSEVIEDADHVFAGRVVDSRDGSLLVEVDEVWAGGPVPERVWLEVGLLEWSGLTDDDGELRDGLSFEHRNLFADSGAIDSTGPCSMWRANDPMLVDSRPGTVSAPVPGESGRPESSTRSWLDPERPDPGHDGGGLEDARTWAAVGGVAGVGVLLSGAGAWWIRRRRQRQ